MRIRRVIYPACNPCTDLEWELIHDCSGLTSYINLSLGYIDCTPEHQAVIEIIFDDTPHVFKCTVFRGKQRLKLPPQATCLMSQLLLAGHTVTLRFQYLESTYDPAEFRAAWNELHLSPAWLTEYASQSSPFVEFYQNHK